MNSTKFSMTVLNREKVDQFAREFESIFYNGDYAGMASYYTEDAQLMGDKMPLLKGRQAIKDFWQHTYLRSRRLHIKRVIEVDEISSSGDLGYVTGIVKVQLRILFIIIKKSFKYATIWKQQNNTWLICVDISNRN
jgi:ketosteroid isomerase-like protein